jgi:hypothetical protein
MGAEMRRHTQDGFEEDRERRRLRDADLDARITQLVERAIIDLDWLTRHDGVDEEARQMPGNDNESPEPPDL